jgi:hypothetical protein
LVERSSLFETLSSLDLERRCVIFPAFKSLLFSWIACMIAFLSIYDVKDRALAVSIAFLITI